MELYLMQHGEARSKEENPDRPLTDAGRATIERVARRAAGLGLRVDVIQHSGNLRARHTAETLANQLGARERVKERSGLAPLDTTAPVVDGLLGQAAEATAVALVSHLPVLDHLASRLVPRSPERRALPRADAKYLAKTLQAQARPRPGWGPIAVEN